MLSKITIGVGLLSLIAACWLVKVGIDGLAVSKSIQSEIWISSLSTQETAQRLVPRFDLLRSRIMALIIGSVALGTVSLVVVFNSFSKRTQGIEMRNEPKAEPKAEPKTAEPKTSDLDS